MPPTSSPLHLHCAHFRSIVGTCRSMGVSVINLKERAAQEEMAQQLKKQEEENRKEEKLYLY